MQIEAAMKEKSYFPANHHDESSDSFLEYQSLIDYTEIDEILIRDRVNSENSQGSEPENENTTMLEEKTIKKYLILKNSRPQTTLFGKRGLNKRSISKDLTARYNDKKVEFHIHKSNSPTKKKELYDLPKGEKLKPKL